MAIKGFVCDDDKLINKGKELQKFSVGRLGWVWLLHPPDQTTKINFTGAPGDASGRYYKLCFQLGKWEYTYIKADEWIEVSPVHQDYYALTKSRKQEMEETIKKGLTSAANAVGDYEMVWHDLRKYEEFLNYLGLKFNGKGFEEVEESDEHSLKTIFVDQVDFYAGGAGDASGPQRLSMAFMRNNNIMPTIVQDFYAIEQEKDIEEKDRVNDLPKVEKEMLRTKWRAYKEWKKMFEKAVRGRYRRLYGLAHSREESIKQYREWLKPYIAKHKMYEEALNRAEQRKGFSTNWFHSTGHATSANYIRLWIWKGMSPYEIYKTPGEELGKHPVTLYDGEKIVDKFTKNELIYNKNYGLVSKYDWIDEDWVNEKAGEIFGTWMNQKTLYYAFIIVDFNKTNLKFASGSELEDVDFYVHSIFLTSNALLAKLLEAKAKQEEMEHHINKLLGVYKGHEGAEKKEEGKGRYIKNAVSYIRTHLPTVRKGAYETRFDDRITKFYLKRMGRARYGQITGFLKEIIGYGVK